MKRFDQVQHNLLRAVEFAVRKHHGQMRKYGVDEPYVLHCIRVAMGVAHIGEPAVTAALLHDVLEDTDTSYQELEQAFGTVIADIVAELTDPPKSAGNRDHRKALMRIRMQTASFYARSIKCADIADNLPSIAAHDPKFANTFLEEVEMLRPTLQNADMKCQAAMLLVIDEARNTVMQEMLNPCR
jgi:guanosine-3',5'-bis(diphosphate) 3'-pyrophosphohydrolase